MENTANRSGLLAEHGFAALVNVGGNKILFDTGASDTFVANAAALGIDLGDVSTVALSHGHYDHTGGLMAFLRLHDGPVDVYAHPDLFSPHYAFQPGVRPRYIGIEWSRQQLEDSGAVFHLKAEPSQLKGGLLLTGQIPRVTPYEDVAQMFQVKINGGWEKDEIWDDQALVIPTPEKVVVISGCAHAGLINTLKYVQQLTGENKIHAFLGGTHLTGAAAERIRNTIDDLNEFGLDKLGAGHCTGFEASVSLANALGSKFTPIPVGSVFQLN